MHKNIAAVEGWLILWSLQMVRGILGLLLACPLYGTACFYVNSWQKIVKHVTTEAIVLKEKQIFSLLYLISGEISSTFATPLIKKCDHRVQTIRVIAVTSKEIFKFILKQIRANNSEN
jgi:hypothetical protein